MFQVSEMLSMGFDVMLEVLKERIVSAASKWFRRLRGDGCAHRPSEDQRGRPPSSCTWCSRSSVYAVLSFSALSTSCSSCPAFAICWLASALAMLATSAARAGKTLRAAPDCDAVAVQCAANCSAASVALASAAAAAGRRRLWAAVSATRRRIATSAKAAMRRSPRRRRRAASSRSRRPLRVACSSGRSHNNRWYGNSRHGGARGGIFDESMQLGDECDCRVGRMLRDGDEHAHRRGT